ncbi:hypothetical protein [Lacticaseibacillus brantae]|uniref:Uncharacterized protein n=1 Tax=Lacticaseibacillus brantae DSM 23927 TaxID=1423727 RepID=A0A0R2B6C4_9LACO|nr:hypothetical protein [Lacticaseibacillus brantae]KRM71833.1 hypothetical protein FC34_GL001494 [Lacticaseibacillus brantae DSM 23927]
MRYELLNTIQENTPVWENIKKRAKKSHETIMTLAPSPALYGAVKENQLPAMNLLDHITQRTYHPGRYVFFDHAPVPDDTAIQMQEDGYINLARDGESIGFMTLFANTHRALREIHYTNPDGTNDTLEEYTYDGSQFSNLIYYNNELQQIQFLNEDGQVVIRYFFFDKIINLITIEDPETQEVVRRYDTLGDFTAAELAAILKPEDTVTISYMATELNALVNTKSHNILRLSEPAVDESGAVRGNLLMILKNEIKYIHEVEMPTADYNELAMRNIPLTKAKIVDD